MTEYDYKFGCVAVANKPGWLVQSTDKNKSSQSAMALDNNGEPKKIHYYQKVTDLSFEALVPIGDSSSPEIGDVFVYDGVAYYIAGVRHTGSNTDFERYSLTCQHFDTANLPAAQS